MHDQLSPVLCLHFPLLYLTICLSFAALRSSFFFLFFCKLSSKKIMLTHFFFSFLISTEISSYILREIHSCSILKFEIAIALYIRISTADLFFSLLMLTMWALTFCTIIWKCLDKNQQKIRKKKMVVETFIIQICESQSWIYYYLNLFLKPFYVLNCQI